MKSLKRALSAVLVYLTVFNLTPITAVASEELPKYLNVKNDILNEVIPYKDKAFVTYSKEVKNPNYNGTYNIPLPVDKRYEQNVGNYKLGDVILIKLENGKIVNTVLKYTLSDGKKKQNPTQNDKNAFIVSTPDYVQGIITAADSDRRLIKIDCGGDLVIYVDRKVKMQSYTKGEKSFEPASIDDICIGDYVLVAVNNYRTDYIILYKDL